MMTSFDAIQPGDIWLTYLRFVDKPETGKVRPILIVDIENELQAVALKVTSKNAEDDRKAFYLDRWAEYGLRRPSYVRIDQVFRVTHEDLLGDARIGVVDQGVVTEILDRIVDLMTSVGQVDSDKENQ